MTTAIETVFAAPRFAPPHEPEPDPGNPANTFAHDPPPRKVNYIPRLRLATRYDKTVGSFLSFVQLAAIHR